MEAILSPRHDEQFQPIIILLPITSNESRFLPAPTRPLRPAAQTPSSSCRNRSESWPRTAPRILGPAIPRVVLVAVEIEAVGAEIGAETGIETGIEIGIGTGIETGIGTGAEAGAEAGVS